MNQIEQSYGMLQEGMHVTGYTFARACSQLEWLLTDGKWKKCGDGFKDVNEFLDSFRFTDFKVVAEKRKKLATMIKSLQPKVSNRQIAKTLGVAKDTIKRDLGANAPRGSKKSNKNSASDGTNGANAPPPETDGREAEKAAQRAAIKLAAVAESARRRRYWMAWKCGSATVAKYWPTYRTTRCR